MAKCRSDREVPVSESFASLSALLGAAPPDSVAGLPDDILARLADQIVARSGAVVSELAPDVGPVPGTFPRRNRVISGLADATVIVEGNHYFPSADVHDEYFEASGTHTVCPWKGTASYHSLVVERDSIPDVLEITAETDDGIVMGLRHRDYDVEGVQFHPESILTTGGHDLIANFLARVAA